MVIVMMMMMTMMMIMMDEDLTCLVLALAVLSEGDDGAPGAFVVFLLLFLLPVTLRPGHLRFHGNLDDLLKGSCIYGDAILPRMDLCRCADPMSEITSNTHM